MPLYIPHDDDRIEFQTCRRDISDKRLSIIDPLLIVQFVGLNNV